MAWKRNKGDDGERNSIKGIRKNLFSGSCDLREIRFEDGKLKSSNKKKKVLSSIL